MKYFDCKKFYFIVGCISLALIITGATYAYFTASVTDESTVKGSAATVTFGLAVERVTTIDMAFGLVPMKNEQSVNAAKGRCRDDLGNAGCQIYKITINADSDTVMFLDGYIVVNARHELLETRYTQDYTKDGNNFFTRFDNDDFVNNKEETEERFIRSGKRGSDPVNALNHKDDADCLLIENKQIGGAEGRTLEFYVMIWVYDNGEAQDYLQGMQQAYNGEVVFVTAEGNEISATFA